MPQRDALTSDQLGRLLDAVVAMSSDLDLDVVLERITRLATELVGARYGALGILDELTRRRLDTLVTHGMSPHVREMIGRFPESLGLLGYLIDHPQPLRVEDLDEHPASFGFPVRHPGMTSFLGVPILVHDEVFGNLYLTEKEGPGGFTEADEEIAVALAAAASVAIENARLYDQAATHRAWLEAAARLSAEVLRSPSDRSEQLVVDQLRAVSGADAAMMLVRRDRDARITASSVLPGHGDLAGSIIDLGDRLTSVLDSGRIVVVPQLSEELQGLTPDALGAPAHALLALPLRNGTETGLVAAVWFAPEPSLARLDPALPRLFIEQAGLALHLAYVQAANTRLAVFEDRDRIGRDLHDLVIQRLFAIGLTLEGALKKLPADPATARIAGAIDDIDETIKDIRRTIFALGNDGTETLLRSSVQDVVDQARDLLGFDPVVELVGPIDLAVSDETRPHLLAVLQEALSNIVRHSGATRVTVRLEVNRDVCLTVVDDGHGLLDVREGGNGLRNMRHRATELGGTLTTSRTPGGGLTLAWRVPLVRPKRPEDDPVKGTMVS